MPQRPQNAPLVGKDHNALLEHLANDWLPNGPPVCVLQGAPGVGKTTLANALANQCGRDVFPVQMETGDSDDLLMQLIQEAAGNEDVTAALSTDDTDQTLVRALKHPVLLVVDEFQRSLDGDVPLKGIQRLLQNAGRHVRSPGRVLLLSSKRVDDTQRWVENQDVHTLQALDDEDATAFLDALLTEKGHQQDVPAERRPGLVRWVHGNPRALKVVVSSLAHSTLDELVEASPETWEARDREVDPELLEKLERALLERTLKTLSGDVRALLNRLSAYRKAFKKKNFLRLKDVDKARTAPMLHQLIDLFLVEQHSGWLELHPVVRDICRHQLDDAGRREAHGRAADDYLRHFKTQGDVDVRRLGGHFVELRYHLVQAQRDEELASVMNVFGQRISQLYSMVSPVPQDRGELDERIAVLSAYLGDGGPKGLEFYLARLLKHRGGVDDLEQALAHARRSTGPNASYDPWVLSISLEAQVAGIDAATACGYEAIRQCPTTETFQSLGETLVKVGRVDEAIDVLLEGLEKVPTSQPLYQSLGETLVNAGRVNEAVDVLREGLEKVPSSQPLHQALGEMLVNAGRVDEAVDVLREGLGKVPTSQPLYQSLGETLVNAGRVDEAVDALREGLEKVPPEKNLFALYQSLGETLVNADRVEEAVDVLREGLEKVSDHSLYQSLAALQSSQDANDDALTTLVAGLRAIPIGKGSRYRLAEQALFLCAQTRNRERLDALLNTKNEEELDAISKALGRILAQQMDEHWEDAARTARDARESFPTKIELAAQEAFSWLAAGQAAEAHDAFERIPGGIEQRELSPNLWLSAWIAVRQNDTIAARTALETYLGRSFDGSDDEIEDEVLRIWNRPLDELTAPHPAIYFPTLPPSLTRLPSPITRGPHMPSNAELERHLQQRSQSDWPLPPAPSPVQQGTQGSEVCRGRGGKTGEEEGLAFFVLATEWESRHGGLSTFNRELCLALQRLGHRVVCRVDEPEDVDAGGVEVVRTRPHDLKPDVIVGHGLVTGEDAKVEKEAFPDSVFVLFVHTDPGLIESHKTPSDGGQHTEKAEEKAQRQLNLAAAADLVVGVGPLLTRRIKHDLSGRDDAPDVVQFNPGLANANVVQTPSGVVQCLVLARAEDDRLKGLDIAAAAVAQVGTHGREPAPELLVRGAGAGTGDELETKLQAQSTLPQNRIHVRPYTPDAERIAEDIRRSSVVLMPSRSEGFGLVGLEALAFGVPILVSGESGLGELLQELADDVAYLHVVDVKDDDDVEVWKNAIDRVLSDREAAFRRARQLRERLRCVLSWEKETAAFVEAVVRVEEIVRVEEVVRVGEIVRVEPTTGG